MTCITPQDSVRLKVLVAKVADGNESLWSYLARSDDDAVLYLSPLHNSITKLVDELRSVLYQPE